MLQIVALIGKLHYYVIQPRLLMVSNSAVHHWKCIQVVTFPAAHEHCSCIVPYISAPTLGHGKLKICCNLIFVLCSVDWQKCGEWYSGLVQMSEKHTCELIKLTAGSRQSNVSFRGGMYITEWEWIWTPCSGIQHLCKIWQKYIYLWYFFFYLGMAEHLGIP